MKRTRTIAIAATAVTALSFTGAGALAYAQTAPTTGPGTPGGTNGHKPHGPRAQLFDAAAKALGMSSADLKAALDGGKTVAQVAQDKGVDVNTVITAVTDAANTAIDQAVTDGKMTADQAAQEKTEVTQRVTDFVNNTKPPKGEHGPGGRGPGGRGGPGARFGDPIATAAAALTMSEADLHTALEGGKTIAQVAQDKGVDPNAVITALTDAANKAIDQAVTDGRLSADQATQAKAKAAEHAANIVNNAPPKRR